MNKRLILALTAIVMVVCASAQNRQLTLEDLNFGGNNYREMMPKNKTLQWWGDQLVDIAAKQCSLVDKKTAKTKVLFTEDELNTWAATGENDRLFVYRVQFPYANKPWVLASNSKERMLIDFKAKKVVWRQTCEGETYEEWNAASKAVAWVKDHNLFVRNADNKVAQLTTDGSREIVYGQTVHRDEFGIYKGTFWSPDGNSLAFYRMDQSMVKDYPLVDIDTRIATEDPIKYPMAGETGHEVTIGVYHLDSGHTTYLKAGNPKDRYFTNIQWSPDGKKIYLIEVNRDQTDMSLDRYDATTGVKEATLYTEHHDKYVHPVTAITFLPWDSEKFILQSEKNGFNHLYLFNTKGEQLKQLTDGNWVVIDLVGFNVAKKSAIILSTECGDIQNNLFAVDIATGKRKLLDNGRGMHGNHWQPSGHHNEILSASGALLFDRYAEPDVPRVINIVDTHTGKHVNYFTADNPWKEKDAPIFTSGTIKAADGTTDLYYRMVKPHDFDPNKKYPTVVYVYGGPGVRNVEAGWHYASRGWESYMAAKGYVLFILDNRGSSDRGLAFEQATFRHLGQEEMKDQMKGVEYLKSLPYVDADRIGVHGWSFGGFMTISLITNYPEVFKVGVAGGPVIDWKWYESLYGERYMDTPQANPEGYEQTSLINKGKDLKGKLQVIIGMNDPVCVPQHSLSFLKACIAAGTQPDFFVYPGQGHNMMGRQSVHLHERITQYFEDYLK